MEIYVCGTIGPTDYDKRGRRCTAGGCRTYESVSSYLEIEYMAQLYTFTCKLALCTVRHIVLELR